VRRLLQSYGFAFLVFVAMVCAGFVAGSTHVPKPVPDYALQAAEIYRLEIGAAFFAAFYLLTLAFLLATGGRGFAKFGPHSLAVEQVIRNGKALRHQARFDFPDEKSVERPQWRPWRSPDGGCFPARATGIPGSESLG